MAWGSPREIEAEIVYSNELTISDYATVSRPLAGQRGVDEIVKDGKLRLATQAEIDAWAEKASEEYKRFNPDLRVEHRMRKGRTYIALNEFVLPNGMYGANSRAFIIPNDLPVPTGPMCHNTLYFMDGTAQGPGLGDGRQSTRPN